jgi:ABC-2 type transport system ATP-binding protein
VTLRTPDPAALTAVLTGKGASVSPEGDGTLTVTGLSAARIGEIALQHRILLQELAARTASLEEAFMELTADSVEYLAGDPR